MATFYGAVQGTYSSAYSIWLDCTLNSQNIANNTSNITVSLKSQRTDGNNGGYSYNSSGVNFASMSIPGYCAVTDADLGYVSFLNQALVTLNTWTGDVTHNADGTLTLSISASWRNTKSTSYTGGYLAANWTLTTIPRASTVSIGNFTIGEVAAAISITRASASFTHILSYKFAGQGSFTQFATGVGASYSWDTSSLQDGWYALIPNSTSGILTIKCDTYSGGTLIGSNETACTAFADASVCTPTITATVADINSVVTALTGNNQIMVNGYSNLKITPTVTLKKSATIASYAVVAGSKTYNSATVPSPDHTINAIDSGSIIITVTDSRGYAYTLTISKTMLAYAAVIVGLCVFARSTPVSTTITISSLSGSWWNNSFGSTANALTLKYRWRIKDGTWSSYISLSSGFTTYTLAGTFSATSVYEFEFVAADKITTVTIAKTVSSGTPIIDIGANDVKVNGIFAIQTNASTAAASNYIVDNGDGVQHQKPLANVKAEIANMLYPVGSIYISTVATNPNAIFGVGTWAAYATGRCLVGIDTSQTEFNANEKTGGEKTHALTEAENGTHSHYVAHAAGNTYRTTAFVQGNDNGLQTGYEPTNTNSSGSGTGHNNLQPYITVYIWKRTA